MSSSMPLLRELLFDFPIRGCARCSDGTKSERGATRVFDCRQRSNNTFRFATDPFAEHGLCKKKMNQGSSTVRVIFLSQGELAIECYTCAPGCRRHGGLHLPGA